MKDLSTYVLKITDTLFQRVFLIIVYSTITIPKRGIYDEAILMYSSFCSYIARVATCHTNIATMCRESEEGERHERKNIKKFGESRAF